MKIKVAEGLYYGDQELCSNFDKVAVVHACKNPCFVREKYIDSLVYQRGHNLFLNLIDPEYPLFLMKSFDAFLKFVDEEIKNRPVFIHCNRGESRSPSLALIYLNKRLDLFRGKNFDEAKQEFKKKFPYNPSRGINLWLRSNWDKIK